MVNLSNLYQKYLKIDIDKLVNPDVAIHGDNIYCQPQDIYPSCEVERDFFRHFFEDEFIEEYKNDKAFRDFLDGYNDLFNGYKD